METQTEQIKDDLKKVSNKKRKSPSKNKTDKSTIAIEREVSETLKGVIGEINGRWSKSRVSYSEVISFALTKLKETDYDKILEQSLTIKDKLEIQFEKDKKRTGEMDLTYDEWCARKIKIQ